MKGLGTPTDQGTMFYCNHDCWQCDWMGIGVGVDPEDAEAQAIAAFQLHALEHHERI